MQNQAPPQAPAPLLAPTLLNPPPPTPPPQPPAAVGAAPPVPLGPGPSPPAAPPPVPPGGHPAYITFPTEKFETDSGYQPDAPGSEASDYARVWKIYRQRRRDFDLDKVDGWNKLFDGLLTFAGLFSAALTVFLTDSYKSLQEASPDYIADLLRNVTTSLPALQSVGTAVRPRRDGFTTPPSPRLISVNALWFSSLLLTLSVALYCIVAKQWVREYERVVRSNPSARAWTKRQVLYWESMKAFGVPVLASLLPFLMHIALFLFAIGLCLFLIDINHLITTVVSVFGGTVLLSYIIQLAVPLAFGSPAWSTSLTRRIRNSWRRTGPSIDEQNFEAYALRWLILSCPHSEAAVAIQAIAVIEDFRNYQASYSERYAGLPAPPVPLGPPYVDKRSTQCGRAAGRAALLMRHGRPAPGDSWPDILSAEVEAGLHAGLDAGWAVYVAELTPVAIAYAVPDTSAERAVGHATGHAAGYATRIAHQKVHGPPLPRFREDAGSAAGLVAFIARVSAGTLMKRNAYGAAGPSRAYRNAYTAAFYEAFDHAEDIVPPMNAAAVLKFLGKHNADDLTKSIRTRIREIKGFDYGVDSRAKKELRYCEEAVEAVDAAKARA